LRDQCTKIEKSIGEKANKSSMESFMMQMTAEVTNVKQSLKNSQESTELIIVAS